MSIRKHALSLVTVVGFVVVVAGCGLATDAPGNSGASLSASVEMCVAVEVSADTVSQAGVPAGEVAQTQADLETPGAIPRYASAEEECPLETAEPIDIGQPSFSTMATPADDFLKCRKNAEADRNRCASNCDNLKKCGKIDDAKKAECYAACRRDFNIAMTGCYVCAVTGVIGDLCEKVGKCLPGRK